MKNLLILTVFYLTLSAVLSADCLPNCKKCNSADAAKCDQCKVDYYQNPDKTSCIKVDYTNLAGWPTLCGSGTKQSPINIITTGVKVCPSIKEFYNVYSGQASSINPAGIDLKTSYTEQSTIEYILSDATLRTYNSAQFHWHSPAEHKLDSKIADLQLHVVHATMVGGQAKYAVAGFFFVVNPNVYTDIFDKYNFLPGIDRPFAFPIDVRNKLVYHYQGSLTAPPCVEAVDFFLYAEPIPITRRNFNKMKAAINQGNSNARPVQTLGARDVQLMGSFCNSYNRL